MCGTSEYGTGEYSDLCTVNVGISISTTAGMDRTYVCLVSGNGPCTPTNSSRYPYITKTGRYTYCAIHEKNGKKSETTCATKYIRIDKKAPHCIISPLSANVKVGTSIGVTIRCSSGSTGGKNGSISYSSCTNIATIKSSGAKKESDTSFSETITVTGKTEGTCTITLPEGYGLFNGKKTPAQTIKVNVAASTTGGNTGGNTGTDTQIPKPTVKFGCAGKEYSSSCSVNVGLLVPNATGMDKVYSCLVENSPSCTPTNSSSYDSISKSGSWTYCVILEKNGKKGERACSTKQITINKPVDETATITIDKKTIEVTAPANAEVTFNCTNADCGDSYTMTSTRKLTRSFSILNTSFKASIDVSVKYNGKVIKSESSTINPNLSCTMLFTTATVNGKDVYKVVANVTGGTGTLTGKGDGTYTEEVANTKYSKIVTSGGKYEFTAKDTSGKQVDCSITLADQYQIVKITQTKSAGKEVEPGDCKSGDSVICTNIYYIKYSKITYSNYQQTKTEYKPGECVASDDTSAKKGTYKDITECENLFAVAYLIHVKLYILLLVQLNQLQKIIHLVIIFKHL